MDLLQLRYFYESAQNENFSVTAKKYKVPPSSVSAAVKRLEEELGHALFERTSNRIRLNHEGKLLADALEDAFSKLDGAVQAIRLSGEQRSDIKILVRARSRWISKLVVEFKRSYPNVFFYITNNPDTTEYDSFDVIIDEMTDAYGGRERFLLSVEKLCIKSAKTGSLVGKTLTVRDLEDQSFVMMGKDSTMRRLMKRIGKENGFSPKVAIECADVQSVFNCVENDMGLTIGSVRSLREESQKNIVPLKVTDFNEEQLVYVYYQKSALNDNALDCFLAFLKNKKRIDRKRG